VANPLAGQLPEVEGTEDKQDDRHLSDPPQLADITHAVLLGLP
jgi:hypothetical protein